MITILLSLLLAVPAQDDPAAAVEALKGEYDAAQSAFWERYGAAESEEEKEVLLASDYPAPEAYAERFLALAKANVGTDAALDALVWVAQQLQPGETKGATLDLLLAHHADSDRLGTVCRTLRRDPTATAERFLRTLLADNPHAPVRGNAAYALAHALEQVGEFAGRMDDRDDDSKALRNWLGEETVARLRRVDPVELERESKRLLELVATEYADVESGRGTLGEDATGDLFELEHLALGNVAPDIEGEDVDGVVFKLSDYRGRVVVLDFWGDW
ncbi:MAG: peroxiredoxin family protein [Planctomycetota bacterium JB042]